MKTMKNEDNLIPEIQPEELESGDDEFEPVDEDVAYDDESGAAGKLKKLREDLKKANQEKTEYLTGWQRAKADYVNLQKEQNEMLKMIGTRTKEKFMEDLLPTLDAFDVAMGNKEAWEKVDANWRMGVEYIYNQFVNALSENGVSKINQTGVPFDPSIHESIETVSTDDASKDNTIAQVIQSGYKIQDRVIRPARVKVYSQK
jgi:molecular chaperone GrpE